MAKKKRPPERKTKKGEAGHCPGRPSIKQAQFLAAYSETGNIRQSCIIAKIHRATHKAWMQKPEYVEKFQAAHDEATDRLEQEARRRAVEGVDEPVYGSGGQDGNGRAIGTVHVGNIRKYSDALLMFLLKGSRPDKFRERYEHRHAGHDGGPTGASMQDIMNELDRRERERSQGE